LLSRGLVGGVDDLFRAFFAVLLANVGLLTSLQGFPDIGKAGPAVRRVLAAVDRTPTIDSADPGGLPAPAGAQRSQRAQGRIEFSDVSFVYPTRPKALVLSSLSLVVEPGRSLALVGPSGSGKSTVVALLLRWYDVSSGSVTVDGVDVRALNLSWLRRQTGLVAQEPALFGTTLRDNIAVGRSDASDAEIASAASKAGLDDVLASLPLGLDTPVGGRGSELSGGQRQRVAIARAVLRDPPILLLDEATSALDAKSEALVQASLDALTTDGSRTVVSIAHRLGSIAGCDEIAVLDGGCVVERGTHRELLERDGQYASLTRLQKL